MFIPTPLPASRRGGVASLSTSGENSRWRKCISGEKFGGESVSLAKILGGESVSLAKGVGGESVSLAKGSGGERVGGERVGGERVGGERVRWRKGLWRKLPHPKKWYEPFL